MADAIQVEHDPDTERLEALGVYDWPVWEKEASEFPWTYDGRETAYILEGEVTVTPDGGDSVAIRAGDLVTFPDGMSCHWNIHRDVRKHYRID
jgi:hypothetical protein